MTIWHQFSIFSCILYIFLNHHRFPINNKTHTVSKYLHCKPEAMSIQACSLPGFRQRSRGQAIGTVRSSSFAEERTWVQPRGLRQGWKAAHGAGQWLKWPFSTLRKAGWVSPADYPGEWTQFCLRACLTYHKECSPRGREFSLVLWEKDFLVINGRRTHGF